MGGLSKLCKIGPHTLIEWPSQKRSRGVNDNSHVHRVTRQYMWSPDILPTGTNRGNAKIAGQPLPEFRSGPPPPPPLILTHPAAAPDPVTWMVCIPLSMPRLMWRNAWVGREQMIEI